MAALVVRAQQVSADWAVRVLVEAGVEARVVEPRGEMAPLHRVYHVAVADGARRGRDAGNRALGVPLMCVLRELAVLRSPVAVVIPVSLFIWVVALIVQAGRMPHGGDDSERTLP